MKKFIKKLIASDDFTLVISFLLIFSALIGVAFLSEMKGKGNKLSEMDVGNVLDATSAFDSFARRATVRVETDKVVVFVDGIVSVTKGEKAWIEVYDTGLRFLCLEHHESCTTIIN